MNPRGALRAFIWIIVSALVAGICVTSLFHDPAGDMFMPHAHCYLFNRQLMMLHGGSDMLIGLSYVSISLTLIWLVFRVRRELPFHWMMLAFATFIIACGITHFMEVWTLQAEHPRYWLSGEIKLLTAIASLITALLLPPLVPKIRALMLSSRLSIERKDSLEKAYFELNQIYKKAMVGVPAPEPGADDKSSGEPSADPDGFPRDLALMARQVTLHAEELERAKQQAEDANHAKDNFLAVLSHELRTPLTPALASANYLESVNNLTQEEMREALALIRRNIELEARLVDDLLDVTRISTGKLEVYLSTVNLHETIQHAVDMCRSLALNKRIELVVQLEAAEHYIRGDGARMAQVFWNILLNAVKFTPAEGSVTVSTSNPVPGSVRITITDTGIGIEPGMISRIFEPFEQGETTISRRFGGVGLGLSIARALVHAHSGEISVSSDGKDKGATFAIDLATIIPNVAVKKAGAAASQVTETERSLRVLLAEDHEDTRNALSRLITRWGHEVKTAATMAEALDIAEKFDVELLISDIGLPDGTGMDLLGKLHRDKEITAIAMSGYGMESDLEQTKLAGFAAHLVKPISAERLKETITRLFKE